jgi:hypothetical protein
MRFVLRRLLYRHSRPQRHPEAASPYTLRTSAESWATSYHPVARGPRTCRHASARYIFILQRTHRYRHPPRTTMSPALSLPIEDGHPTVPAKDLPKLRPTHILHRTPWRPPVAVSAQGIYVELENGQRLIDAAGGAAVTCLGHGHPKVVAAMKEQLDKVSCEWVL